MLDKNAQRIAEERYFKHGETQWSQLSERVATHVIYDDIFVRRNAQRMIYDLDFLPNSPTLMNAGTELPQLSACFVVPILEDSMKAIFQAVEDMAEIQKAGGGTGFDFSILREKNSLVSTTKGRASGIISFMKVFDKGSRAVEQGGIRRGANMGKLDADHPDVVDFITYKAEHNRKIDNIKQRLGVEWGTEEDILLEDKKELTYFNLSIGCSDAFMEKAKQWEYLGIDTDWELISRKDGSVHSTIKMSKLWTLIKENAHKSGDPGMLFMDVINRFNPIPSMPMKTTNPCGEQPLGDFESCVLGSINLSRMLKKIKGGYSIDYLKLEHTTRTAVQFLDRVLDINHFPLPQIKEATRSNRKIGLGIMGYADLLYKLKIRYGSASALEIADMIMAFVNDVAFDESVALAEELGSFPNWGISIFNTPEYGHTPMRNATRTTIAPTGSISILAGCSSGIEPNFSLGYYRTVRETHGEGSYQILMINPVLEEELKERGLYSDELVDRIVKNQGRLDGIEEIPQDMKDVFVTTFNVTTEEHLMTQSAFQNHVDNAVSKTINMPMSVTPDDIGRAYIRAYELGLKGITIYRDGSLGSQVLNNEKAEEEAEELVESPESVEILVDGEVMLIEKEVADGLELCDECGEKSYTASGGCGFCYSCGYSRCHSS